MNENKLPAFSKEYKFFCHRNVVRNILYLEGFEYPELLIKNTIDLKRSSTTDSRNLFYPAIINDKPIVSQIEYIISEWRYSMDWALIESIIKNKEYVVLNTDVYYLPYSKYYKKEHGSHSIIISDVKQDKYKIIDWYSPQFFVGWLNKEVLEEARNSQNQYDEMSVYSGYPINMAWQHIKKNNKSSINYSKAIYEVLEDIYFRVSHKETISAMIDLYNIHNWVNDSENKYTTVLVENLFSLQMERKLSIDYFKNAFEKNMINPQLYKKLSENFNNQIVIYGNLKNLCLRSKISKRIPSEKKCNDLVTQLVSATIELSNIIYEELNYMEFYT